MNNIAIVTVAVLLFTAGPAASQRPEDVTKALEAGETDRLLEMLRQSPELLKADYGSGMTALRSCGS